MSKAKPVAIGDRTFPSITAVVAAVREVFRRYGLKEPLNERDAAFIAALFAYHPDYLAKVDGRVIERFEIHPHLYNSHCFYAIFTDGGYGGFLVQGVYQGGSSLKDLFENAG